MFLIGFLDDIKITNDAMYKRARKGLFMEVHDNVEKAKSDATTQWPLSRLEALLIQLKAIKESLL